METSDKNFNILVTGGKGFLGRHLLDALEAKGHRVSSFDIVDGKNLLDYPAVEEAVSGKDLVYHLAAVADLNYAREHPRETMDVNIVGTINVAEACRRQGAALYYISTCCVYGNQEFHPVDETAPPKPTEIYAYSKLAGEQAILGYAAHFNTDYNIIRTATFYGEHMRGALAPFLFLKKAMRNEPLTIHGTGRQTRTFTYVGDIVEGLVLVLERGIRNEIINLTTEEEISVLELADLVLRLTGSRSEVQFTGDRSGQIHRETISAKKAKDFLGWSAKTKFADGLNRLHQWMYKQRLHEV